ncbi:MAG TPA: OsmC family protein [Gemmatimonadaceae bacterium]
MERQASAVWNGTLKEGRGTMSAPSGVLKDANYTWAQRFADDPGTNPEELVAAAHAGCYSMALSGKLTAAGFPPERIATTATVTLEKMDAGMTVTKVHLRSRARVPGISPAVFAEQAEGARATCPISRLLNAKITLDAAIE